MSNYTTFETAKRLKDARFPQPEPEVGQVWYFQRYLQGTARHWAPLIRVGVSKPFWMPMDGGNLEGDLKNLVFAPTAADILRQLPGADLSFSEGDKYAKGGFDAVDTQYQERQTAWDETNAAEALAKLWFKIEGE